MFFKPSRRLLLCLCLLALSAVTCTEKVDPLGPGDVGSDPRTWDESYVNSVTLRFLGDPTDICAAGSGGPSIVPVELNGSVYIRQNKKNHPGWEHDREGTFHFTTGTDPNADFKLDIANFRGGVFDRVEYWDPECTCLQRECTKCKPVHYYTSYDCFRCNWNHHDSYWCFSRECAKRDDQGECIEYGDCISCECRPDTCDLDHCDESKCTKWNGCYKWKDGGLVGTLDTADQSQTRGAYVTQRGGYARVRAWAQSLFGNQANATGSVEIQCVTSNGATQAVPSKQENGTSAGVPGAKIIRFQKMPRFPENFFELIAPFISGKEK